MEPEKQSCTLGMLCHLLSFTGFIIPFAIRIL